MKNLIKKIEDLSNFQISLGILGFSLLLVFLGAVVMWANSKSPEKLLNDETVITIATTIFPLADIAKNVGGDRVNVVQLLPSGATPHSYDLTPGQVAELSKAKVLFVIGHGLDDWAASYAKSNNIPVKIVDTDIDLIQDTDGHEEGDGYNPHYWLSIPNGMIISRNIRDVLVEIFPKYQPEFEANQSAYAEKLAKADLEIRRKLPTDPKFLATFHGAWDYMAKNYGFMIIAEFEEFPGKEPTAQYLSEFQNEIRVNSVKTIYIEPQLSTDAIRPLAADLGANLVLLDPLGGSELTPSYLEMMQYNLNQVLTSP